MMLAASETPSWLLWTMPALAFVSLLYAVRRWPQALIRFFGKALIRSLYRVRSLHHDRIPPTGGVLMLPNHVSYVDALILSTACQRPIRFVIWDTMYHIPSINGLLRIFGAVPISKTRAKDAVRSVVNALHSGEIVCLFPEGQITRHGMINELRKGFELMARQADCPVLPVYVDGLWGSIFSFESGLAFRKWPKRLRYPATVTFGPSLPPSLATRDQIRTHLYRLASDAFLHRPAFTRNPPPFLPLANALRLGAVHWHHPDDLLLPLSDDLRRVVNLYAQRQRRDALSAGDPGQTFDRPLVVLGRSKALLAEAARPRWQQSGRLAIWTTSDPDEPTRLDLETALGRPVHIAWIDAETGAWLALGVPDPPMPPDQLGNQSGHRPGTWGRLLPGLAATVTPDTLALSGLAPDDHRTVTRPGLRIDADGFVCPT